MLTQVIDYTIHSPLHEYLIEHHSQQPFNAIHDIVGNKDLHTHCPTYLTEDGLFDSMGAMAEVGNPSWAGLLRWVFREKLERFRPVMLGGIPRQHRMHNAFKTQTNSQRVVKIAEEGKLKVPVDSVWKMEDAVKAYEITTSLRARGKVVIAVQE